MDHLTDQADGALGMVAGAIQSKLEEHSGFDPETVSSSNDGLLVDADRLERQAEAAAAVADAVEHAGLK